MHSEYHMANARHGHTPFLSPSFIVAEGNESLIKIEKHKKCKVFVKNSVFCNSSKKIMEKTFLLINGIMDRELMRNFPF